MEPDVPRAGKGGASNGTQEEKASARSVSGALKFAALVITVLAGASTLAFSIDSDLKPCLGGYEASFTGVPVFPNSDYEAFQRRSPGADKIDFETLPDKHGAEVRVSFSTTSLRHEELSIASSLVRVKADGTLGAVDQNWDRLKDQFIRPETCDETVGRDLFVEIPERVDARYLVVLELYRGDERLALAKTEIFAD